MLCWWPRSLLTEKPAKIPICSINKPKDCMEKKSCLKITIMDHKPLKTEDIFFTQGHKHFLWEICCQKAFEKFENNNEIKVCLMRWRTRGRLGGKKTESDFSWRFLFCPGKWDVFLPYVHLPQLTAHIRKGLLKRGNNEKERERWRAVWCASLLSVWQEPPLSRH